MSKELNFQFGDDVLKYQDSNSALNLYLSEDGVPFDLSRFDHLSLKIGNENGYLLEKDVDLSSIQNPENGNLTIALGEEIMQKLIPGDYNVEIWGSVNPILYLPESNEVNIIVSDRGLQDSQAIFPSDGNLVITVDDNIDSSPYETINTYAIDEIKSQITQWENDLTASIDANISNQLSEKASTWQGNSADKLKNELLQDLIAGGTQVQQQLTSLLSKSVNTSINNLIPSIQENITNNIYANVSNQIIGQVNQKIETDLANEDTSLRSDLKSFVSSQVQSSINSLSASISQINSLQTSVTNINNELSLQNQVEKAFVDTEPYMDEDDIVGLQARKILKPRLRYLQPISGANVDFTNWENASDGIYPTNAFPTTNNAPDEFSGNGVLAVSHGISDDGENIVVSQLFDYNGTVLYKIFNGAGGTIWDIPKIFQSNKIEHLQDHANRLLNIDPKYTDATYKQNGHVNTPAGMMNDIQSINKVGDHYNIYYLNNDIISFQSEWELVTTKDFKTFEDKGVAISRNTGDWESVATGSVIPNRQGNKLIDSNYNADVLFAYFVSFTKGHQNIERAISRDNGMTFQPTQDTPVIAQPSNWQSFRDPCATYDSANNRLVLYITTGKQPGGGDYISAFTSSDGVNFDSGTRVTTFDGQYTETKPGNIECPVVIENIVDKADGSNHAIMFISGNSGIAGNGCYYQLGQIQNGIFVPDGDTVTRLDKGIDTYASNYVKCNNNSIVQLAWLGDWQWQYGSFWNNGVCRFGSIALPRLLTLRNGVLETSIIEPDGLDYQYALDGTSFNVRNDKLRKFSVNFKTPADNCMMTFLNSDSNVTFNFWTGDGQQHITTEYHNVEMTTAVTYVVRTIPKTISHLVIYSDKESLEIYIPELGDVYTVLRPTKDENMLVEFPYEAIVQTTDIR